MGFDMEIFVDQPVSEDYTCTICFLVLEKPMEACRAKHIYCQGCIDHWKKQSSNPKCPACRSSLNSDKNLDKTLQSTILGMAVLCPASDDKSKCDWEGSLNQFIHHSKEVCIYREEKCSDCNALMCHKDLKSHQENSCRERWVHCPNCNGRCRAKNLQDHKALHCPEQMVDCRDCKAKIRKKDLHSHKSFLCPNRYTKCTKCKDTIKKINKTQHEEKQCPGREVTCPHCKMKFTALRLDHHIKKHCTAKVQSNTTSRVEVQEIPSPTNKGNDFAWRIASLVVVLLFIYWKFTNDSPFPSRRSPNGNNAGMVPVPVRDIQPSNIEPSILPSDSDVASCALAKAED